MTEPNFMAIHPIVGSLTTPYMNLMVALEEKSEDHQSVGFILLGT